VFIIGTGRSGTHFLTAIINQSPDLDDIYNGKESPLIFERCSVRNFNGLGWGKTEKRYYDHCISKVKPRRFVDQCHANIWSVEQILEFYPTAKFLYIERQLKGVVYSMLNHSGVRTWANYIHRNIKENKFLGITPANRYIYFNELDDAGKAVFRWLSHKERGDSLLATYPESILRIQYENLVENFGVELVKIFNFLDLDIKNIKNWPEVRAESLSKSNKLSSDELDNITKAIEAWELYRK
jgi:hypothetical protein